MAQMKNNEEIAVFGHINPDLDSYASAYAYAKLLSKLGLKAKAYSLGAPNLETKYVLKFLQKEPIKILSKLNNKTKVILLDHNAKSQSLSSLNTKNIIEIIDHHRLSLVTPDTINVRIEKVGSTATIIFKKYMEFDLSIDYNSAVFLLAAILSDTRVLTSPTTTKEDIFACKELSKKVEINYKKFGQNILLAGTNNDQLSIKELYLSDFKKYKFGKQSAGIAVIKTVNISKELKRKKQILDFMESYQKKNKLNFSILLITDIIKKNSYALCIGDRTIFYKAFGIKKEYLLKSVVSRKRQVVPKLESAL